MEILHSISLVVRSAIYLWVGVESLFLHSLYNYGYQKFKPTPIIHALHKFFFYIGVFFIAISFVPIFSHYAGTTSSGDFVVRNIGAVFALLAGIFLTKFRTESLKESPGKNPLNKKGKTQ